MIFFNGTTLKKKSSRKYLLLKPNNIKKKLDKVGPIDNGHI